MTWRLHLTNQTIAHLDIIDGDPTLLAVWLRHDRVVFHDLANGAAHGECVLVPPETDNRVAAAWHTFVGDLVAPGGIFLPQVQMPDLAIYATNDGRVRLYNAKEAAFFLDMDGHEIALDCGDVTTLVALAFDNLRGSIAALRHDGTLYIFQQHALVSKADLGSFLQMDLQLSVAISQSGSVFVTDGQQIILVDFDGTVQHRRSVHYVIRLMACSPNGQYLTTYDMETGVIRVYDGLTLTLCYQRFAIDLVANAAQVQLMAKLPSISAAATALAINDTGIIAFAMSGVVCVTELAHMGVLPRSQTL
jgi:hypothetical protein